MLLRRLGWGGGGGGAGEWLDVFKTNGSKGAVKICSQLAFFQTKLMLSSDLV